MGAAIVRSATAVNVVGLHAIVAHIAWRPGGRNLVKKTRGTALMSLPIPQNGWTFFIDPPTTVDHIYPPAAAIGHLLDRANGSRPGLVILSRRTNKLIIACLTNRN